MAKRRAFADGYAVRLNRAVALLGERSPAERTAVFTVRLPESPIAAVRATAARAGNSLSATTAHALRAWLERADGLGERSARGGAPR
jgi:hypothetical protein